MDELGNTVMLIDSSNYVKTGFRPQYKDGEMMIFCDQTRLGNIILQSNTFEINSRLTQVRLTILKTHSRFDLLQLHDLKDDSNTDDRHIETGLLSANFDGKSVLHELSHSLQGLKAIEDHLISLELNSGRDYDALEKFERTLRRLYYAFSYHRITFHENHKSSSETVISTLLDNPSYRDALLKIGKFIPSFNLVQHYKD